MTGAASVHRLGAMSALFPAIPRIGTAMAVAAVLLPVFARPLPANAQEEIRNYGRRMEAMFVRMDSNGDGRLVPAEVQGQPYLERRLRRPDSRGFLLMEDLYTRTRHHSGPRLQNHFHQADHNGDGLLNRREAKALPWISRHFNGLDLNGDGLISLEELWSLQKALSPRLRP